MRAAALTLLLASSPVTADVRSAGIRRAVHELGDARPDRMDAAVDAALALERPQQAPDLDAALILAISWAESRFDPGARRGPPCGVMQVVPQYMREPARSCRAISRSIAIGMEAGVREVLYILRWVPSVRGDLRRALEYRACGNRAFTRRCRKRGWLLRVEGIAERLRTPAFRTEGPQ